MLRILASVACFFALTAPVIAAPFSNGSYDSGLSPWSVTGGASVGGALAGQGPISAPNQAILQTEPSATSMATLATTLGTTISAINGLGPIGTEGSGISQSWVTGLGLNAQIGFGVINVGDTTINSALLVDNVSVADNGTLSFQWNFLTDELDQASFYNDTAFLVVNGVPILLASKNVGVPVDGSVSPGFDGQTGFHSFSQQFAALQNPEPASMLAWGLIVGVGGLGYRLRKRKLAQA